MNIFLITGILYLCCNMAHFQISICTHILSIISIIIDPYSGVDFWIARGTPIVNHCSNNIYLITRQYWFKINVILRKLCSASFWNNYWLSNKKCMDIYLFYIVLSKVMLVKSHTYVHWLYSFGKTLQTMWEREII